MVRYDRSILLLGCLFSHAVMISEARILGVHVGDRVDPKLAPKSHTKFFDKDYPSDKSPSAKGLGFKHPYPAVQDSNDFEKDYIKDENHDNGLWKTQMEYDKLRTKLVKKKKDASTAFEKEQKEERELEEAQKEAKTAEKKASDAKKKVDDLEKEKDKAENALNEKRKDVPTKDADDASQDTEKAAANLEDCKEQLRKAREELKTLLAELEEAKKKEEDAEKSLDQRAAEEKQAELAQKEAMIKVEEEDKEYQSAEKVYEEQQKKTLAMQEELKAAEKKVEAYRVKEDPSSGKGSKSAASPLASPVVVSVLATAFALLVSSQA